MLFIFFFLFLPLNIQNFQRIKNMIKTDKKFLLLIFLMFPIYFITFKLHPYNYGLFFLRNILLSYFQSDIFKALFYLPIAYSILSIRVTCLLKKYYYFLYPLTLVYLIPSSFIEQRYYIIPYSLFILFKKSDNNFVEYVTVLWFFIISAIFFYLIRNRLFFL